MNIYIENESETEFGFPDYEQTIKDAVLKVAEDKALPEGLDVNILIVSSDEIQSINKENRDIDSATDVLSFPYYEYDEPGVFKGVVYEGEENILGDIILCADKIISQAAEYGHSQRRELSFLVVHSMLHLLGYDHIKEDDRSLMEEEQRRFMQLLGISR